VSEPAIQDQVERIQGNTYRDLSTVVLIPALSSGGSRRAGVMPRVFVTWLAMHRPMNHPVHWTVVDDDEVGVAYERAFERIVDDSRFNGWSFALTLETDNLPPPDGLMTLYESMDQYDVIGGLYWTKSQHSVPLVLGDPSEPNDYTPQLPLEDQVQPCNGLGMGFTLFRLSMFRDRRWKRPWFETRPQCSSDITFFKQARQLGFRVACDTRVQVGHYDDITGQIM
jgi:hypothetical protein